MPLHFKCLTSESFHHVVNDSAQVKEVLLFESLMSHYVPCANFDTEVIYCELVLATFIVFLFSNSRVLVKDDVS